MLKTFLRTLIFMIQVSLYPSRPNWNCIISLQLPRWLLKAHNKPWFKKNIWSWLYFSVGSEDLWAWTFTRTSWNLYYVSEGSCFPDCWRVSSVVSVFQNVGKSSTAKNYHPVSLLSVVSKVFEKLINIWFVDHLHTCGLFWFRIWF